MSRLILWPGLAADERMYRRLGECGWELVTPRLPIPKRGEAFTDYARRCAEGVSVDEEDVVGGCSFGSLVAGEIARQRPVRGLVLLAGALDSTAMPAAIRWLGSLPALFPMSWLRRYFASDMNLRLFFGEQDAEGYALAREMLADTADAMLDYGGRMAIRCKQQSLPDVPVFALHGREDRVMTPPPLAQCQIIAGAGHGLVFSHAGEVTHFLRDLNSRLR